METFISYYKISQLNYSFIILIIKTIISIINVISTVIKALMTSAQPHPKKKEIGIGILASLLKKIHNRKWRHCPFPKEKKWKQKIKEKVLVHCNGTITNIRCMQKNPLHNKVFFFGAYFIFHITIHGTYNNGSPFARRRNNISHNIIWFNNGAPWKKKHQSFTQD